MRAILKSTTNAQMLSEVDKTFLFYNAPVKNQPFACYGVDTRAIIFSSMVAFVGNVGNTLRIATANSEYIFEVIG
ncbi:hypothetical protein [uncultured Enterococcus sp.]|uniref:hypothetical protein n=1 Tax=uncultured Enterococcus sp. TaxID=167972 RepID=UPI00259130FF|nr:hypothetical protein [uncultured Enterococcus sp.]